MTIPTLHAVVLYESMFGNTEKVARAVAAGVEMGGIDTTLVEVNDAHIGLMPDVDLLVLGAPTHAFSLSRARTRADAVQRGASPERATYGLREWLGSLPARPGPHGLPELATFDTRIPQTHRVPLGAATRAARLGRRLGLHRLVHPESFQVRDMEGPVLPEELERAVGWGRVVAEKCRDHVAAQQASASR